MRYLKSIVLVAFLSMAVLLVFDSCSTSKKTTTRKGDASIAANAPDYKRIKKEINTKGSEFYYPELLRRFQEADTTLTAEQLYYFYYGTATRPDYNPYRLSNYDGLKEALGGDEVTEEGWRKAAQVVDEELESDPTNLRFHVYRQMVYSNLYGKESQEATDAYNQVIMLFTTITSSGNGKTPETAFQVISTTDEYGMMDMLGLSLKSQSLVERHGRSYDLMEFQENNYELESLYFDVTVCMEAMHKMFGF